MYQISDVAAGLRYCTYSHSVEKVLHSKKITEVHSQSIVHGDLTGVGII